MVIKINFFTNYYKKTHPHHYHITKKTVGRIKTKRHTLNNIKCLR